MKRRLQQSYIAKLIKYLLFASITIIILLIGIGTIIVRNCLETNTSYQIQLLVKNHSDIFDNKISNIEKLIINYQHLLKNDLAHAHHETLLKKLLRKDENMNHCKLFIFNNKQFSNNQIDEFTLSQDDTYRIEFTHNILNKDSSFSKGHIIKHLGYGYWIQETIDSIDFISFCQPLVKNYRTIGLLQLSYQLNKLTDNICNSKLFKSGRFFLINNEGRLLTDINQEILNNDINTFFQNHKIYNHFSNDIQKSKVISFNNKEYIFYHTPLQAFDWQIGIFCPMTEIFEDAKSFYILGIAFLVFILVISSYFIIYIVSYSHKPLQELISHTQDIAEGKFKITNPPNNASKEIVALYNAFNKMQHELDIYIERIKKETQENERINTEIMLAQRVQNLFLSHEKIQDQQIKVCAQLKQSRKVGGDLYDYFLINRKFYFMIGDVSGKGMPAAIYMGSVMKLLRYISYSNNSPAQICSILNNQMIQEDGNDMYITLLVGIVDLDQGILTYSNAGHPYPIYINDNGDVANLKEDPDVPIGIVAQYQFEEHQIRLIDKEIILLYTDGITDAEDKDANFYGKERLQTCIENCVKDSPKAIVDCIIEEIDQHIDGVHQSDDLTLLAFQYLSKI